ncbi:acyl-CoA dehydrogenase family protein [Pseudenhygromyxa sp. WMMC2535]|uniref:acyl-CoA dehydrogenase family protein n=1 Tax=Pseudenhygromyxa sp. WMMC2535 TaxID=2712867 RepID=UPI0015530047|nr:acyl-CoA dehydrogenase family protein [Pseudenhygromyxa sp. WMMC2535]NVB36965.1 acyl-CoA dehydrogenase family protein [Pseudenhygromyxa sp. WMMC2535]
MKFTEEHELLRKTVNQVIDKYVNPHVDGWEAEGAFPAHEVFKRFGEQGLLGLKYPEEHGGAGLDYSYTVVMAEELANIDCGGVPLAIGVQTDMCTPALARFGSEALRREFLEPSIAGDLVGCIGVSEVGAGSDVAAIKTHARKEGDDFVINGGKMWITNGHQADWMCCLVNTVEGAPAHKNKSLIVVPLDAKGIDRSTKLDKLGMRSSDTAQIFFENVRVPQRNLIGQEGFGFFYQMLQFQEERLWGAAHSVRSIERMLEWTIDYTRERKIFGGSVLDNQWVHYRIAEMTTEVEALKALVYRATELYVSGKDVTKLASMAKLKCGRLCREVADWCVQFHGGMGYMNENRIVRAFRDARLVSIGAGADEVMMGIICKYLEILPKRRK